VASAGGLSGVPRAVMIIAALILGLLTAILGVALGVFRDVRKRLPQNRYGLCSGSSDMRPDRAGVLPLTDWLHDFFQNLAGSTPTDDPVTFGDLWGNGGDENAPRDIELVLMTTSVTRGISHCFPFLEGSWGQLYFDKGEFDALFPKSVVDWMVKHAAGIRHRDRLEVPEGFHPIPKPADLPILLGARTSLSFPVLLSAVPLYAANFERAPENGKYPLERCWFSDGGLTSNFPIHFFDAPLPGRPTFGINLVPDTVETTEIDETDDRLERVKDRQAGMPRAKVGIRFGCRATTAPASRPRPGSTNLTAWWDFSARCSTPRGTGVTPSSWPCPVIATGWCM